MKNLSTKLGGALAACAIVFASFSTSTVQAETVAFDNIAIEDIHIDNVATADWYVICGSRWCAVVASPAPSDPRGNL